MTTGTQQPASKPWPDLGAVIDKRLLDLAFQPIVRLTTGEIVAVEALTRPHAETGFPNPGVLFAAAEAFGRSWDLEKVVRERLAEEVRGLPEGRMLFFNTSPQVFADERYPDEIERFREASGLDPSRFVLEITERAECGDSDILSRNALELRARGYQVAIDDMGAGSSGLNRIMSLRPSWLKLDRELARDIDSDAYRQNLIRFLGYFTRLGGARLIAEGVERIEELSTLFDLGADCVQGFVLAKPGAVDQELDPALVSWMRERGASAAHETSYVEHLGSIEPLSLPVSACRTAPMPSVEPLDIHTSIATALAVLADLPVIEQMAPVPARGANGTRMAVRASDLIRAAAKQLGEEAKHSSPMFAMPDSFACDLAMHERIAGASDADAAIIDIRRMAEYNAAVGHDLGDVLLRHLASILRSAASGVPGTFVGHLGDDRFLLIARPMALGDLVEDLVLRFDRASVRYASPGNAWKDAGAAATTEPWLTAPSLRVLVMPGVFRLVATPREVRRIADRAHDSVVTKTLGGSSLSVLAPEEMCRADAGRTAGSIQREAA